MSDDVVKGRLNQLVLGEPVATDIIIDEAEYLKMRCEVCGHIERRPMRARRCASRESEYGAAMPLGCDGLLIPLPN